MIAARLLICVVCLLAGYFTASSLAPRVDAPRAIEQVAAPRATVGEIPIASPAESALVAEWEQMRSQYGRESSDLPALYLAVKDIKDAFHRRAFRAALLAEWATTDPRAALAFLGEKDSGNTGQLLRQWLRLDPQAAVNALLADEKLRGSLRGLLSEIAADAPERLAEVISTLPKSESRGDTTAQDAFAVFALKDPEAARRAAESVQGPQRGQALAGVAKVWAETDGPAALAWAQTLAAGDARDAALKAVLMGWAKTDPAAALEKIDMVPPGGEENYYGSDVGAQVLREAAKRDWDGTLKWLRDHPGKLGQTSLNGMQEALTKRLAADPAGTMRSISQSGLPAMDNVLANALLNDGYAQRDAIWQWLDGQAPTAFTRSARGWVLNAVGWKDPVTAIEWIEKIPDTTENKALIEQGTRSLFNGGSQMDRFEELYAKASPKLRASLIEAGFSYGREAMSANPALWVSRLNELPADRRANAISGLAGGWAANEPGKAIEWARTLTDENERASALTAATSGWAQSEPIEAAQWINTLPAGKERDIGASGLVQSLINTAPEDAWTWAQSIADPSRRMNALMLAQMGLRQKDPAIAKQTLENSNLTPAEIQALNAAPNGGMHALPMLLR